jgi:exodeoxyribonuclease-3
VRIATWNINGLRARQELLLHWLRERAPDLVGLQELKLEDAHFPIAELERAGYRAAVLGQRSWNGVAILAREPLEVVERGLPGEEEQGARLLAARAAGVHFTTVYVPNGKHVGHADFSRKLAWLDSLAAQLGRRERTGEPAVLCGDFNLCPGPLDSWNEEGLAGTLFHTDAERARFRALLDGGFVDLFRERFPDTQAFSWWDYRGGAFHRKQGLRIDLLLANAPLAARVRGVEIDRAYRKKVEGMTPSDHAPVIADLDLAAA